MPIYTFEIHAHNKYLFSTHVEFRSIVFEFFNLEEKNLIHKMGYLNEKKKKKKNMILIDERKIPLDTRTHALTQLSFISKPIESVFTSIYLHLFFT